MSNSLLRAERIRKVIETLAETNKAVPVIVEGRRDEEALRDLGLLGELITFHRGMGVYEFCEFIAERHPKFVLLMDWDTEGEGLQARLGDSLGGRWEEFTSTRTALRALCQKDIRDVEGIPKLLRRLEDDERAW